MTSTLYKVVFQSGEQTYEVYARQISQDRLFGFIEIEELVFGEHTTLLVDPAEEKLEAEFSSVKRSYIPMHAIIRIDEVEKRGTAKIIDTGNTGNVTPFPVYTSAPKGPADSK